MWTQNIYEALPMTTSRTVSFLRGTSEKCWTELDISTRTEPKKQEQLRCYCRITLFFLFNKNNFMRISKLKMERGRENNIRTMLRMYISFCEPSWTLNLKLNIYQGKKQLKMIHLRYRRLHSCCNNMVAKNLLLRVNGDISH